VNEKPGSLEVLEQHIVVGIVELDGQKSSGVEDTTLRQPHSKAKNLGQCEKYAPPYVKIAGALCW
jgi:hypothetical protein